MNEINWEIVRNDWTKYRNIDDCQANSEVHSLSHSLYSVSFFCSLHEFKLNIDDCVLMRTKELTLMLINESDDFVD